MTPRALILTGGIAHPFAETAASVAAILSGAGLEASVTEDFDAGLARVAAGDVDLLVVHGLRWSMTQHPKYEPDRPRYAYRLDDAGRAAITGHLAAGRGLLGLHTASICFDDWDGWRDALGLRWVWGRSHHPPPGPVTLAVREGGHPITRGVTGFTVVDELYSAMDLAPGTRVLAEARIGDGGWEPAVTVRDGPGRAAYVALGHDMRSVGDAMHGRLLAQAALWCVGRDGEGQRA